MAVNQMDSSSDDVWHTNGVQCMAVEQVIKLDKVYLKDQETNAKFHWSW